MSNPNQTPEAIPDVDNAKESSSPRLPEGTYELIIRGCRSFMSADVPERNMHAAPIFATDFEVAEICEQGPIRTASEKDTNPPPGPAQVGELRGWGGNMKQAKTQERMRDFAQAALRFVPRSGLAEAATFNGAKIAWKDVLTEAVGEDNVLEGKRIRCTIARIVTQQGKGFAMYVPTFTVSAHAQARTSAVVDSF